MTNGVRKATLRNRIEVDLDAIEHNAALLAAAAPGAQLCAVVKADGYGHGAVPVARHALRAGARWLAVAHAREAEPLRADGLDAPVLLLTEPTPDELGTVVDCELRSVVYSAESIAALGEVAARRGRVLDVHLKVDTGMRRVGCRAVGRARADRGGRPPAAPPPRGAHDPLRPRRRAGAPRQRPAAALLRGRARRISTAGACGPRSSTPPTRPPCWPDRRPTSTWCGPGSPSTAWRRRRRWPAGCPCAPPCPSTPASGRSRRCRGAAACPTAGARRRPRDTVLATLSIGYADGVRARAGGGRRPGPGRRAPSTDDRRRHHGPAPGGLWAGCRRGGR